MTFFFWLGPANNLLPGQNGVAEELFGHCGMAVMRLVPPSPPRSGKRFYKDSFLAWPCSQGLKTKERGHFCLHHPGSGILVPSSLESDRHTWLQRKNPPASYSEPNTCQLPYKREISPKCRASSRGGRVTKASCKRQQGSSDEVICGPRARQQNSR